MASLLESNIATQGHVITSLERFDIVAVSPNVFLKPNSPLQFAQHPPLLAASERKRNPSCSSSIWKKSAVYATA